MSEPLTVLPNAEALVSSFFRKSAFITSTALGDRTYTELPKRGTITWPACRVTRVGGPPEDMHGLLDEPLMQIEVWGGPKVEAQGVAQTLRAALAQRLPYRNDEGCLMAAIRFGGLRYIPDTSEDPARPRYLFDVTLRTRP